jgi:hypothetical protein
MPTRISRRPVLNEGGFDCCYTNQIYSPGYLRLTNTGQVVASADRSARLHAALSSGLAERPTKAEGALIEPTIGEQRPNFSTEAASPFPVAPTMPDLSRSAE